MAAPSKAKSKASENLAVGSPRKRIYSCIVHQLEKLEDCCYRSSEVSQLTPELPAGSRESAQAFVL